MVIITEEPFRNYNPNCLKFDTVKNEVSDAMQFDWKRDKVDDAKKKAIYQATSYDDFTARVKGCTLKPIHRNEFNEPPKFNFNRQGNAGAGGEVPAYVRIPGATSSGTAPVALRAGRAAAEAVAAKTGAPLLPKNARELDRELRKRPSVGEKADLLAQLDGEAFARMFPRDMDAELFRQMLVILEEAAVPGEGRRLLRELAIQCPGQLATASAFLTPQERGIAARLLARDRPVAEDEGEDVRICASLGVPPAAVAAAMAALGLGASAAAATTAASAPASACDTLD